MVFKDIQSVYFLGIGGIGMSALARYFSRQGIRITGYDRTPSPLTDQLISEGMSVHFTEDLKHIPADIDLVVRTPAIPATHPVCRFFTGRHVPVKKRAEVLGEIAAEHPTIAVAGTHGKTTISTLIAHILLVGGKGLMAFLGGISKNYGTNFIEQTERRQQSAPTCPPTCRPAGSPVRQPDTEPVYCVAEADEYDRSFLYLSPDIAIISAVDPDHLDIYSRLDRLQESFSEFIRHIRSNGSLILKSNVHIPLPEHPMFHHFSYALNTEAGFYARNIFMRDGLMHFDFVTPTEILPDFVLGIPGMFNLENAIAALAAGYLAGIDPDRLRSAVSTFQGVTRRFDIRIRRNDLVYIDDYAHHPEELKACIHAVRELFPGKRVTGIFQPHLYSRTRDLMDDFANVLSALDDLILLDIYPAREKPIKGITSAALLKKVILSSKCLCRPEEVIGRVKKEKPEVLLTLGAGDIDRLVIPIIEAFG